MKQRAWRGLTGAADPIRVLIVHDSATQRRLIAQHPESDGRFSRRLSADGDRTAYAGWLHRQCAARLDRRISPSARVAAPDDRFGHGEVNFVPGGGTGLMSVPGGGEFRAVVTAHAPGDRTCCPSVDRLFGAAVACASRVPAMLLSGMVGTGSMRWGGCGLRAR